MTNELSAIGIDMITRIAMAVQPKLHQTAIGRLWAQRLLDQPCTPTGLKDQIVMVYDYIGMKASQMMYKYLSTAPLVLVLPGVIEDASRFKAAYEDLMGTRGPANFP